MIAQCTAVRATLSLLLCESITLNVVRSWHDYENDGVLQWMAHQSQKPFRACLVPFTTFTAGVLAWMQGSVTAQQAQYLLSI